MKERPVESKAGEFFFLRQPQKNLPVQIYD